MHIIGFLIFGLIVGLLARAIYPGKQSMGWLGTAVVGMIGSLVGGLIGHALWGGASAPDGSWGFTPGGLISSIRVKETGDVATESLRKLGCELRFDQFWPARPEEEKRREPVSGSP